MTTCNNCFTNRPDCRTCPERINMHEEMDIEQDNAEKALDRLPGWIFGCWIVVIAVVLIVGTACYL